MTDDRTLMWDEVAVAPERGPLNEECPFTS
jgi:hypothetical protein